MPQTIFSDICSFWKSYPFEEWKVNWSQRICWEAPLETFVISYHFEAFYPFWIAAYSWKICRTPHRVLPFPLHTHLLFCLTQGPLPSFSYLYHDTLTGQNLKKKKKWKRKKKSKSVCLSKLVEQGSDKKLQNRLSPEQWKCQGTSYHVF